MGELLGGGGVGLGGGGSRWGGDGGCSGSADEAGVVGAVVGLGWVVH